MGSTIYLTADSERHKPVAALDSAQPWSATLHESSPETQAPDSQRDPTVAADVGSAVSEGYHAVPASTDPVPSPANRKMLTVAMANVSEPVRHTTDSASIGANGPAPVSTGGSTSTSPGTNSANSKISSLGGGNVGTVPRLGSASGGTGPFVNSGGGTPSNPSADPSPSAAPPGNDVPKPVLNPEIVPDSAPGPVAYVPGPSPSTAPPGNDVPKPILNPEIVPDNAPGPVAYVPGPGPGTALPGDRGPEIHGGTDPVDGDYHIREGDEHNPGNSPGQQIITGDYILDGLLRLEIAGTIPGLDYDQLLIGGDAYLYGSIEVVLLDGFIPELDDVFDVLVADSFTIGADFSIAFPELSGGRFFAYDIVELSDGRSAFRIVDPVLDVAEPSTLAILGLGLVGLAVVRRRRKQRS